MGLGKVGLSSRFFGMTSLWKKLQRLLTKIYTCIRENELTLSSENYFKKKIFSKQYYYYKNSKIIV